MDSQIATTSQTSIFENSETLFSNLKRAENPDIPDCIVVTQIFERDPSFKGPEIIKKNWILWYLIQSYIEGTGKEGLLGYKKCLIEKKTNLEMDPQSILPQQTSSTSKTVQKTPFLGITARTKRPRSKKSHKTSLVLHSLRPLVPSTPL